MHVPRLPNHPRLGRQASALRGSGLGQKLVPHVPRLSMGSQGLQKLWQLHKTMHRANTEEPVVGSVCQQ